MHARLPSAPSALSRFCLGAGWIRGSTLLLFSCWLSLNCVHRCTDVYFCTTNSKSQLIDSNQTAYLRGILLCIICSEWRFLSIGIRPYVYGQICIIDIFESRIRFNGRWHPIGSSSCAHRSLKHSLSPSQRWGEIFFTQSHFHELCQFIRPT